jgi:hypothetical protein
MYHASCLLQQYVNNNQTLLSLIDSFVIIASRDMIGIAVIILSLLTTVTANVHEAIPAG